MGIFSSRKSNASVIDRPKEKTRRQLVEELQALHERTEAEMARLRSESPAAEAKLATAKAAYEEALSAVRRIQGGLLSTSLTLDAQAGGLERALRASAPPAWQDARSEVREEHKRQFDSNDMSWEQFLARREALRLAEDALDALGLEDLDEDEMSRRIQTLADTMSRRIQTLADTIPTLGEGR